NRQGMILKVSDKAMDLLADLGYDPQFGARPMKRVLQKEVVNQLSQQVLSGDFGAGDTIYIDTDAKGLTFGKAKAEKVKAPKKDDAASKNGQG
ncbi:MAG: hypothetical protein KDC44_08610, partial [Phaeodactylibacter sp.]|nr:hypothetical protein [Phaeodactylibacter sp.]